MRTTISLFVLLAALAAPAFAQTTATATRSTTIDPAQMPDGTYTATVEKILDSKHIQVKLSNGSETTLTTVRENVDFSKAQPNEQIRFSVIKGLVAVYAPVAP